MHLTEEEERMLGGEMGEATRLGMEVLSRIGNAYGAERLVEIKSVHADAVYPHLIAGVELMEKYADLGGKFRVPTTGNPAPRNFDLWEESPEPLELERNAARKVKAIEEMGVIPNWSCTPYFQGNAPRFGQCVSWIESSAITFANSVLGARTNRTTMGVEVAAAITGRTPEFGLLLDENRAGNTLVELEYQPKTLFDYGTLGWAIGNAVGGRIPVINHLPRITTPNQLKVMGASAASRGSVPLYHAVGVTPEARTLAEAFKGKKHEYEIKIGEKEIKAAMEAINTAGNGIIDAVLMGCPHPRVEEIQDLAMLLRGRKVRKSVRFCLFASSDVINWSRRMGYIEVIEAAGVKIFEGDCIVSYPIRSWGWKNIATNSATFANILPSDPWYVGVLYAETKRCVELATT
jgi:predicted aconitase